MTYTEVIFEVYTITYNKSFIVQSCVFFISVWKKLYFPKNKSKMSVFGNGHWNTMHYIINYNDLILHETRIIVHVITIMCGCMFWLGAVHILCQQPRGGRGGRRMLTLVIFLMGNNSNLADMGGRGGSKVRKSCWHNMWTSPGDLRPKGA